jgi:hypothetical protein
MGYYTRVKLKFHKGSFIKIDKDCQCNNLLDSSYKTCPICGKSLEPKIITNLYDMIEMVENKLAELKFESVFFYDNLLYDELTDEIKWYDGDEQTLKMSKLFPDIIFAVYGIGEEKEDIWWHYYKNGKMQKCPAIMTFDEYDENKLK